MQRVSCSNVEAANSSFDSRIRFIYISSMGRWIIFALMLSLTPAVAAQQTYTPERALSEGVDPCMFRYCSWQLRVIYGHLTDAMERQDREEIRRHSRRLYDYLERHPEERYPR